MSIKTVSVQSGDTLWSIAEKHLGNGQRWRDLFNWNVIALMERGRVPERIGPNFIWPGTELIVVTDIEFEPSGN